MVRINRIAEGERMERLRKGTDERMKRDGTLMKTLDGWLQEYISPVRVFDREEGLYGRPRSARLERERD